MRSGAQEKPAKTETRLSIAWLVILAIVAAGVFLRQFQINPAVRALRPEAYRQALAPQSDQATLIEATASGIRPFSPPERFGPDTLYEKINGRADLYLASGFASLSTQRFSPDDASGAWVEVFVYDMTTPANAFSVFSMQRREGARPDDVLPNAYRTENALFMTHANFYLEFIGTDASQGLQQAMGELARLFVASRDDAGAGPAPGAGLFPMAGFSPDSLQLIAVNAFGFEQLDQVYTAEYLIDATPLTAFVSPRPTPEAASALALEYRQTLASYGAQVVEAPPPVAGAGVLRFFDTYEIVFSQGRYLAGVHEAGSLEAAAELARKLAGHLQGAEPEP